MQGCPSIVSVEINWSLYWMTLSIHCGNGGISESTPPFPCIDGLKNRRSPHKGTDSHRKNKLLFGILLTLQCCSRWIHRDRKATRESFTKTQMEKLWFYYVLSRSTLPRGLILSDFWEYIDCFLLASSLLLKRIVDSFAMHRRFFCLESTLLLESTDDSFGKQSWILGPVNQLHFPKESFPYFNGLFFSSFTTNSR